jgi:hypothetical protein
MSQVQIEVYEEALLNMSNKDKCEYGRRLVAFLGGIAGPAGKDGGIDGWYTPPMGGETLYFQVKLSKFPVPRDDVKLIRQTCNDNNSSKALFISVRQLSRDAAEYAREHRESFQLCHLTMADILSNRHYALLRGAGFSEAEMLAQSLIGAIAGE